MGTVNVDLNNINLYNIFDDDDLDTIIFVRRLFWHIKSEKRNESMAAVWNFCVIEDEKKELEATYTK